MPWLGRERFRATVSVFPISHGEPFGVTNRVSQPHDYIYIFDNHIFDEYYCITFVIFCSYYMYTSICTNHPKKNPTLTLNHRQISVELRGLFWALSPTGDGPDETPGRCPASASGFAGGQLAASY